MRIPLALLILLVAITSPAPASAAPSDPHLQTRAHAAYKAKLRAEHLRVFELLDVDRSGGLDRTELEGSAMDLGGFEATDTDHSGIISRWEFLPDSKLHLLWQNRREQVLNDFRHYDQDRNGVLSAAEMGETPLTLKQADRDKNGRVTFGELLFAMLMTK